ncbi:spermatogenesis-associated protein 6 [Spea bombifrons]|uniref:spermatogenesis-associated protein 6 n=1 Tax=Spea bombifrons TaxID=233779 RepID=UPI00234A5F14|nr:spermatogenesis-associated protein 6 [Spea bombifrons]
MQKQKPKAVRKNSSLRTPKNYERPTIASKSRSPSPYTRRRMCELSEDAKQRLAHLNLGPYEFKKETGSKPPFVVRHKESFSIPDFSFTLRSPKASLRTEGQSGSLSNSLLGSSTPMHSQMNRKEHGDDLEDSLDSLNDHLLSGPAGKMDHSRTSLSRSAPPSMQKHLPSPVLNRSSLRDRFHSEPRTSANWEEIHARVTNLLRTHSARRLNFDGNETGEEAKKRDLPRDDDSLQMSKSLPLEKTVHLDNGHYWSNRAAAYKGKSHRAVFEESMEKIYRNMYRNASEAGVYTEPDRP